MTVLETSGQRNKWKTELDIREMQSESYPRKTQLAARSTYVYIAKCSTPTKWWKLLCRRVVLCPTRPVIGKLIILSSKPGSPRQTLEVNLYQTSITRRFDWKPFFVHKNNYKLIQTRWDICWSFATICWSFRMHSTKRDPPTSLETTLKQGIKEPFPRSKGILPCGPG